MTGVTGHSGITVAFNCDAPGTGHATLRGSLETV
ncbi:hypothetical protein SAMN05518669_10236 [Variovorax sp. YR634]|jgi:hypothetical protein|nr:hypothetical protein [Variovorax boronicumulans]SDW65805.1 hypothetical protein SAMN05518669_10236 [Variovorax sp. YR634]SDZ71502.1 hypothetical protein SAMN05518854_11837 [Variovorax sp. YR266]SOD27265.1 hypothetical protein SAMN05518800_2843 [Variovorax sp. YR752]